MPVGVAGNRLEFRISRRRRTKVLKQYSLSRTSEYNVQPDLCLFSALDFKDIHTIRTRVTSKLVRRLILVYRSSRTVPPSTCPAEAIHLINTFIIVYRQSHKLGISTYLSTFSLQSKKYFVCRRTSRKTLAFYNFSKNVNVCSFANF